MATDNTSTTGGLIDPKYQGALSSEDIKTNLQNEIARKAQELGSYNHRLEQGAAWLAPRGNLAQSLALSNEQNRNDYADLFNMRQQLAQANLLESRKGQVSNLFQGFDPNTAASLTALYQQDPEEALKKAADIRAENSKLTNTQKENTAAGLTPEDVYRKTLGSEFDLDTYANKEGIKSAYDLKSSLLKDINKSALDTTRELKVQDAKLTSARQEKIEEGRSKESAGVDSALNAVDTLYNTLTNPKFDSSWFDALPGSQTGRRIFSPEVSELQDTYRGLSAKLVLPSAKQLGSNPSNRDAQIIQSTIGSLGETKGALAVKLYQTELQWKVAKAKSQYKGSDAEWAAEGGPGEQAWAQAIESVTPKYQGLSNNIKGATSRLGSGAALETAAPVENAAPAAAPVSTEGFTVKRIR